MPWHKRKGPERGAYGGEKTAEDEKEEKDAQEQVKAWASAEKEADAYDSQTHDGTQEEYEAQKRRWHKKESDDNKQGWEKKQSDKQG